MEWSLKILDPHRKKGKEAVGEPIALAGVEAIMSVMKYLAPAAVLLGGLAMTSTSSYGKPEYVKITKKACTFCHVDAKAKPKELTAAGKYFKEHNNSLDGFKAS